MPESNEASALRLAIGTPVLAVSRIARDTEGRAVEVDDMVLPSDRYELMYELPAEA